jgi:hypothetical protein
MKADAMNLSTIPKRYLISAIAQRSPNPSSKKDRNISKLKEFVTYPSQKREREEKEREKKSEHLQNEGECSKNPESQKSAERLS